jgi:hypothetical protein
MLRQPLLLLPFALAVGCPKTDDDDAPFDAGPIDSGEAPDGCSTESPCALVPGMKGSDLIAPVGDIDAWTFDVASAGKVLNVLVENDATVSNVKLEVVLFDPDQQSLANERFVGNGRQRIEIQLVAPKAGQYRVVVRDVGNDGQDRLNPYFVTVQILDETDTNEPNDMPGAAKPLTPGTASSGTIGFQGDADWFTIDVPANALVQIAMSVTGSSPVRLRWALFDSTGTTQIALSNEPSSGMWPVESRAVGNMAGTYLIRVTDDDDTQADLARVYVLTVTFVNEPDANDLAAPNETWQAATPVSSGQAVTGYVAATSDFDWYRIQVTNPPAIIHVRASMPSSDVDLAFELLDRNASTPICDARDGDLCRSLRLFRDGTSGMATLETAHVADAVGTYYLLVRDHQDNDFDYQTSYSVTVSLPPDPDPNETYNFPDDPSSATRVPITTGTAGATIRFAQMTGYISYANDEDWFQLDIPGPVGAPAGQNGDWLIELHLENDGPTPVELEAFFYGNGRDYQGYGKQCRDPMNDPMPCVFPDADNAINDTFGEQFGDCFVVFREITGNGPHFFRMTDLDRDDFDFRASGGAYRFSVTLTAGCPVPGECEGVYLLNGADLCGRP